MSIVFAIIIEGVTIVCTAGVLFAGEMRTAGAITDDKRSAWWMFGCGTAVSALLVASHWVGW
jgi:hypothetical protein